MRNRGKSLAVWANILIPAGGGGILLFWFFAFRLGNLLSALLLALLVAGLFGYAIHLFYKSRPEGKQALRQKRRRAVEEIARMEKKQALKIGFSALRERFSMEKTDETKDMFLADCNEKTIAIGILQALDQTGMRDVQVFDALRGALRGVLLCCGEVSKEAREYAARLQPELVLLELEDLPLPLEETSNAPDKGVARGIQALLARACSRERAKLYVQSAMLLLVLFILTDRVLYLLPCLILLLFMAICAMNKEEKKQLFRS